MNAVCHSDRKGGKDGLCFQCRKAKIHRVWAVKNRDHLRTYNKTLKDRDSIKYAFCRIRSSAAQRGISIDRIDSTKSYTKGNIQIMSWRANRLKMDASLSELETPVAFLRGES